jgi:hypothetical protein
MVLPGLCAGVAFGLVILPAVLFNSLAAGSPQFVSGQGSHLWLSGNTEFAIGVYQLPCGQALGPWSAEFWALQGRKLLLFFSNEEFGNNTYIGVFRGYLAMLPPAWLGFGWLAGVGVLGLLRPPGQGRRRWLGLWLVLGLYVISIVAFAIVGRYRLPAAALLCVPAASVLVRLPALLRRSPWRTLVASGVVVGVLGVASNTNLPVDVSVPFAHFNASQVFAEADDEATAQRERDMAHRTRLAAEARDPHGCLQLPPF